MIMASSRRLLPVSGHDHGRGMAVVATAGHVDHGKSALVRALTGMEPDRWAEERRRGLTIDLGFAWCTLPGGEQVAFVDVPGHERFVPNMLAGVGPVPAVLFVVAADGGWMPQSAEHLAAIDAMGIRHGLLAVTRSDLADPGPATRRALAELARTSLGTVDAVAVSAVTGAGLPELLACLDRLVDGLPRPDPAAPVRLWADRSFSIKGSGTVVTGTLPAGTIGIGDELQLTPSRRAVRVRAIESLGAPADPVAGVARVALNLRGIPADEVARGHALVTPAAWTLTTQLDVRLHYAPAAGARPQPALAQPSPAPGGRLPAQLAVHVGSARTVARLRPLGPDHARLILRDALPLHVGDRLLLRDPGAATLFLLGATVLDPAPVHSRHRDAAAAAAAELSVWPDVPAAADLLRRHGLLRRSSLSAMGVADSPPPVAPGWLADPARWERLRRQLATAVAAHARQNPLSPGLPIEAARAQLGLPDRALVEPLLQAQGPVRATAGLLYPETSHVPDQALPQRTIAAVRKVLDDLAKAHFAAPEAGRLRQLGLDRKQVAAAARHGLLLKISDQIVLAPGADRLAAGILAGLSQPFTTAEARQALGTTRRVAIPLLEYLDRAGRTERLPDDRRRVRG
jgi:selenocysteine-specific elongation factor